MKKKLVAIILSCTLAASMITACGNTVSASADTQDIIAVSDSSVPLSAKTSNVSSKANTVSDEDFEEIQDMYSDLCDLYDLTMQCYKLSGIKGNKQLESKLKGVKKVIDEIGDKEQYKITEKQVIDIIEQMTAQAEILDSCLDIIDKAVDENGCGDMVVDDEIFEVLQDNYNDLLTQYNLIVDAYNKGVLKQNKDAETALKYAKEYIDIIGEIEQEQLTLDDALEIQQDMLDVMDTLNELIE